MFFLPSIWPKTKFGSYVARMASNWHLPTRVLRATDHVTQRMPEFMNFDRRAIKGDSHPQGAVNAARYL